MEMTIRPMFSTISSAYCAKRAVLVFVNIHLAPVGWLISAVAPPSLHHGLDFALGVLLGDGIEREGLDPVRLAGGAKGLETRLADPSCRKHCVFQVLAGIELGLVFVEGAADRAGHGQ